MLFVPIEVLAVGLVLVAAACFLVALTVVLVRAFDARRRPGLAAWHRTLLEGEFREGDLARDASLQDYLEIEDRVFLGLPGFFFDPDEEGVTSAVNRFARRGITNPCNFPTNWNRTFERVPETLKGGALLIHGLTDSPYSFKSLAETLCSEGYYVLVLRMPGHGTAPSGLLSFTWKDCAAAVEIGARHVRTRIGESLPFVMAGYSNGGALAMNYALESIEDETLTKPSRVFLFSPAMGITSFARTSTWHKLVSWIPFFEKAQWMIIVPEYDPYKYNSLPENAVAQTWSLTRKVQSRIRRLKKQGRMAELPPILTFQSVADATILADSILRYLYDGLPDNGSQLVVFDINRFAGMRGLFVRSYRPILEILEKDARLPYRFTVVTNASPETRQVAERSKPPFSTDVEVTPLDLEWPAQVYSLAHVSIPFSPQDPCYGRPDPDSDLKGLPIGDLSLRGEKNLLIIPTDHLMRLRYNPFHSYMMEKIRKAVG